MIPMEFTQEATFLSVWWNQGSVLEIPVRVTTAIAPFPSEQPPLAWMICVPQKSVCLRWDSGLYTSPDVGNGVFITGTLSPDRGKRSNDRGKDRSSIMHSHVSPTAWAITINCAVRTTDAMVYFIWPDSALDKTNWKTNESLLYTTAYTSGCLHSPVSMLSLTMHSPASRAASHGSSRPSNGISTQSPGTSSTELTHSSSSQQRTIHTPIQNKPMKISPSSICKICHQHVKNM